MRHLLVVVAVAFSAAALAQASPEAPEACALGPGPALAEGPVAIGFFSADVATGRRACPRTEVGLQVGGGADIDIPLFRAVMGGGTRLFGSYALRPRLELFGTLDVLQMTYAQNASLSATLWGLGQLTGGATYAVWSKGPFVAAATARLMLPTTTMTVNVHPMALEAGAVGSYRLGSRLQAHAFLGTDFSFAITPATPQPRLGFSIAAGAQWAFWDFLALAVDLQAHFGDRGPFDYLAPMLALRYAPTKALGLELAAGTHVLGDRAISLSPALRTDTVVALRASYRL